MLEHLLGQQCFFKKILSEKILIVLSIFSIKESQIQNMSIFKICFLIRKREQRISFCKSLFYVQSLAENVNEIQTKAGSNLQNHISFAIAAQCNQSSEKIFNGQIL